MALTFATGMTLENNANAVANWAQVTFAGTIVNGVAGVTLDTTVAAIGAGSMAVAIPDTNVNWAVMFDYFTAHASVALNLTTAGNEVLAFWVAIATPALASNLSAGGIYIIASSSTDTGTTLPTAYRRWYVSGQDAIKVRGTTKGGWYLVMVDTRKAASVADVGAPSLAAIHRIGIGSINSATSPQPAGSPPPNTHWCGGVFYGRPRYQVKGDGVTTAKWSDLEANSRATVQDGLIEDKGGGIYVVSCGLRIGDAAQGATTTFSDATGTRLVFKRQTYWNVSEVDALNYSDYYNVDAQGAASFKTSVTLGSVVGAGNARQGVQGGGFLTGDQANVTINADFTSANLSAVNMYGVQWIGLKGGIKFDSNVIGLVVSNIFQRSGEVDCGTVGSGAVLLNCTLIDPEGGTAQNYGLKLPSVHNIKNVNFITSGTPATQHMLDLSTSGTYTVTMDNLQFFGTYSGTVLHGDLSSATLTTATASALNGANPDATQFSKTGNASSTIVVNNNKTLKVTVADTLGNAIKNARVAIYKSGNILAGQELLSGLTNASGVITGAFNYSVDQAIVIRVRASTPELKTPVNAAFTAGVGTLAAATYYYRVTATNDLGETLASAETSFAAAANTGVNVNWISVTDATGYKVYGRSTGAELLMATVGAVTTWLDGGSVTPSGAMPSSNTTGTTRYAPIDASGTITVNGYTASFTLIADLISSATPL